MRTNLTWMLVFTIAAAPTLVQAQNTTPAKAATNVQLKNVELSEDGELRGQVLTESGMPGLATIAVRSDRDGKSITQTVKTDENGRFAVNGLATGICVFAIGEDTFACRVWNHGIAPPKSLQTIAVVPTSGVVLAQNCTTCEKPTIRSRLACMTGTQKALLVGVIAAAIIIPIALDDDDNAS
jgi:hypothetical protein